MRIGKLGMVELVEAPSKDCGKFAIYLQRAQNDVLLTDGAWTNQRNCFKGPLQLKPRLFDTRREALQRADLRYHSVREYDGPQPQKHR